MLGFVQYLRCEESSCTEAFRVSHSRHRKLMNRKRRIAARLRARVWTAQGEPMMRASNIHYEVSDRVRGLGTGGIGALHVLARRTGLIDAIDGDLQLLKAHLPYHESDHVLNIAYNAACGGTCLEDLELRRNDEAYLEALGAQRIPDPTTAGDFCRRFAAADVERLQDAINAVRVGVWRRQPAAFFEQALLDVDGALAATGGECKQGIGLAHDGTWGYHPLIVSLANTQEPLYLSNRSGNRPSHEGAAAYLDRAIALCRRAGFGRVRMRGDTDFSQTAHLDRWDQAGDVTFVFGIDAMRNLIVRANGLAKSAWKTLARAPRYEVKTTPRARPENVKERIVVEKECQNLKLLGEQVAEFAYRPTACQRDYRVIVLRKKLSVARGPQVLFEDYRYFFYITNDRSASPAELAPRGQPPLQSGKSHRPAQGPAGAGDAGGQSDQQLGLYGDGVAGLDAQGLVRLAAAGTRPLGRPAATGQAARAAHGVQELRERVHPRAVPNRARRPAGRLPPAGVEPLADGVRPRPGGAGLSAALLNALP